MAKKYTKQEFWKLYEKLPQELKNLVFDEKTGNNIYDICKKNGAEESVGEVVDCVSQVLVGLLPLENFQEALEKEAILKKETAENISQEINQFIFSPVKKLLGADIGNLKNRKKETAEEVPETKKTTESSVKDAYREPID